MKKILVLFAVLLCISACAGRLPKKYSLDTKQESVFIIGVAPENYKIFIHSGKIKDGKFQPYLLFRNPVFYAFPENGFVVGKAAAGDTLAITAVRMRRYLVLETDFVACEDTKTMTFNIPSGKVLYLGHIEYDARNNNLFENYSKDINSAKSFVEKNYPNLRGRVEPWEYQLLPVVGPCIKPSSPCIGFPSAGAHLFF